VTAHEIAPGQSRDGGTATATVELAVGRMTSSRPVGLGTAIDTDDQCSAIVLPAQ
jgi:hypothetical protein